MRNILIIILSFLLLSACRDDKQKDLFLSQTEIKVLRYDRLQFEATTLNSITALQKMNIDFPQATKLLIEDVVALGSVDDDKINDRLCEYYSDSSLVNLMFDVEEKYKDLSGLEAELTKSFRKLKKEIPSLVIPCFYSQISALNQSIVVGDSLLGISLDKYMGEDYPLYKKYYYSYQRKSMNPERIVPDCVCYYLYSQYPFPWERNHRTLLDIIMYRGKISWIAEKVLGTDELGSVSLGYDKEQLKWCKENKKTFMEWMKNSGHISSTDPMLVRAYILPYPTNVFSDKNVPPAIGVWIGMQCIDEYMKNNKDMTIEKLLETTDYIGIFNSLKR